MDPFNDLSTAATVRMIPLLRQAPPTKFAPCALVASTGMEKALDAAKEVIRGVGTSSVTMAGWPAKSPGRPATVGGRLTHLKVCQPSVVHQSFPTAQDHSSRHVRALSPSPTIGKEHCSVMPTRPSMGVLTLKKITIRCQLVVPSSSSDNNLPFVRYDARVNLNSGSARIHYTQEPALMSDSPS
jgi:hypothetical protein